MIEVYYAEDDEMIGKSVKEYLEQQNCKVSVFDRIADAKKALIGHLPTIVLLDWNMPDGQGNELCLWIRERWKTLPIIYLTVRGDSHDMAPIVPILLFIVALFGFVALAYYLGGKKILKCDLVEALRTDYMG